MVRGYGAPVLSLLNATADLCIERREVGAREHAHLDTSSSEGPMPMIDRRSHASECVNPLGLGTEGHSIRRGGWYAFFRSTFVAPKFDLSLIQIWLFVVAQPKIPLRWMNVYLTERCWIWKRMHQTRYRTLGGRSQICSLFSQNRTGIIFRGRGSGSCGCTLVRQQR